MGFLPSRVRIGFKIRPAHTVLTNDLSECWTLFSRPTLRTLPCFWDKNSLHANCVSSSTKGRESRRKPCIFIIQIKSPWHGHKNRKTRVEHKWAIWLHHQVLWLHIKPFPGEHAGAVSPPVRWKDANATSKFLLGAHHAARAFIAEHLSISEKWMTMF